MYNKQVKIIIMSFQYNKYCWVYGNWRITMSYLIYLKRSFKLRLKRHMILYVILTCAIILPLIISIFRDSIIFGNKLSVLQQTQGHTYHVQNAKPEYLEYFESIPGLSSSYKDNTIFIDIESEEATDNSVRNDGFSKTLNAVIEKLHDENLLLIDMPQMGSDESYDMFPNQLLLVNAFIMIISFIVVQSAYKNHLNKFTPDIGVLVSCGAENKQIRTIFLFEFFAILMISVISAVSISSVLMYLLFHYFLQVKDVGNLSWLIFRIDPMNLVLHILVFSVVLLLVFLLCLNQKLKKSSIIMLRSNESGEKLKHYSKTMVIEKNAVESLGRLLSYRTKSHFIGCLVISIPVTFAVIFIFNYLIVNIENATNKPAYEITIHKDAIKMNTAGISKDDIAFVKEIEGIKNVKEEFDVPVSKYLIKDNRMEGYSEVVYGNDRYAMTFINPYADIEDAMKSKDFNHNKYNVAINKNHKYLEYKVGDKIYLYLNEIGFTEDSIVPGENDLSDSSSQHDDIAGGLPFTSKPIELTVVQLLDDEWTDRMFPIYFTDELYSELTSEEVIYTLQLKLDSTGERKEIISTLKNKFTGEYTIRDNYEMFAKNKETSIGIYILALFIFSIMFAFILVILYAKLTDYVEAQTNNIRIFHILGASKSDIYYSYMRLSVHISMLSIIASFILGLGFCILFFQNTGYHLILNITTILVHLMIAMLIIAAFNVPVHLTLKKKMEQF